jgi:diguanylate cyclase (GGDEF)-like protein
MAGRAPPWASSFGAFLAVIAMAHGMYVLLLLAVVRLRAGQARAEESARLLHLVATTDTLTGLPNRRALNAALQSGIASARQSGQPLAVALIDIDHFKAINDTHGHAAGDDVLRQIGQVMQAELRRTDGVGRWGGEEFLLCLPGTSISAAADLAERLRLAVQLHEFPHGQPVTVSIGLAQLLGEDDLGQLLQRTDRALYRAKAQGRNRTEIQTIGVA